MSTAFTFTDTTHLSSGSRTPPALVASRGSQRLWDAPKCLCFWEPRLFLKPAGGEGGQGPISFSLDVLVSSDCYNAFPNDLKQHALPPLGVLLGKTEDSFIEGEINPSAGLHYPPKAPGRESGSSSLPFSASIVAYTCRLGDPQ